MKREKKRRRGIEAAVTVLSVICFLAAALALILVQWYIKTFDTSFDGLLYTLKTPLKGAGNGFWTDFHKAVVPPLVAPLAVFLALVILLREQFWFEALCRRFTAARKAEKIRRILGRAVAAAGFLALIASTAYCWDRLNVSEYIRNRLGKTKIYEEYCVDPLSVAIVPPEEKPNLIWLVLESMETTYADEEDGGREPENYMPNLTRLARENISFSDTEKLGGFRALDTTNWTMAALFAGTSGLPFSVPVHPNNVVRYGEIAPDALTLGDVLRRDGYVNEFLCGSDGEYGGRATYFRGHGSYEIYDLFRAREEGDIPKDYYVWWGFEDRVMFRIAKKELTRLAEAGEPFNLTMLTVDAHHLGGYTCEICGTEYGERTANVIACTDRQVDEFVAWCREQPFWDNTVLVITGDHPRMDTYLVEGVSYRDRTIYNCFINARKQPAGETQNRDMSMMDMFPTILSAMGYTIEGGRLELGTDLFSGRATLMEEIGYDTLNSELQKYSGYFIKHFAN